MLKRTALDVSIYSVKGYSEPFFAYFLGDDCLKTKQSRTVLNKFTL